MFCSKKASVGTDDLLLSLSTERCSVLRLYRGVPPLLAKQLPYTIVQLTAFSFFVDKACVHALSPGFFTKNFLWSSYAYLETRDIRKGDLSHGQQLSVSVLCGVGAGVLSSLASQPGDTILSRINMAAKTGVDLLLSSMRA